MVAEHVRLLGQRWRLDYSELKLLVVDASSWCLNSVHWCRRPRPLWVVLFPRQGVLNCLRVEQLSWAQKWAGKRACVHSFLSALVCGVLWLASCLNVQWFGFPVTLDCHQELWAQLTPSPLSCSLSGSFNHSNRNETRLQIGVCLVVYVWQERPTVATQAVNCVSGEKCEPDISHLGGRWEPFGLWEKPPPSFKAGPSQLLHVWAILTWECLLHPRHIGTETRHTSQTYTVSKS